MQVPLAWSLAGLPFHACKVALCMHVHVPAAALCATCTGAVQLPVPYHIPPRPYGKDDQPWCIKEDHDGEDRWGCIEEEC
jgi:hypothetical protein